MHLRLGILSFIIALFLPFVSNAQESESSQWSSEFGAFAGSLLPNMIDNVTEIQPFAGARYGLSTDVGAFELEGAVSNAHGVSYQMATLSYRGEIVPAPDIAALFYIGPDFHRYTSPQNAEARTVFGFHVGAGGMLRIAGPVWFRGDMRFNSGPGTSLYLLFGLTLRTGSSSN